MSIPIESSELEAMYSDTEADRVVVRVEDLSIRYRIPHERIKTLKEFSIRLVQGRLEYTDFWALKGVGLKLHQGEVLGVIGSNGAGKSTLLKVVARVLKPTAGRVETFGSIAPLLELGAGLHPELTGRENIFLNSAMLGRPRRLTEQLYQSTVGFSGLGEFIDAPLRTYSTGMVARLGFSVATCVRHDILIIDEVLSVGDTQFREQCYARIREFQQHGASIMLVSHNLSTIRDMCDRAVWLQDGAVQAQGAAEDVTTQYIAG